MIQDGTLWQLMENNDEWGYIQTASTPGEDKLTVGGERRAKDESTGLVAGAVTMTPPGVLFGLGLKLGVLLGLVLGLRLGLE